MQIKQTAKRIVSLAFVRHAATLVSGNVIGQMIALAAYLLLCSLYTPTDFGLFHLFLSVGGFLAFFTTCSFHYAIVLPQNDKMGVACTQICLIINLIATTICLIGLLTVGPWLTSATHTDALTPLLPLLSLYIFACGLWSTLNYWFIRNKQFRSIAHYQIGLNTCNSAAKVGLGACHVPGGLITGTLIGGYLSLLMSGWHLRGSYRQIARYSAVRTRVCLRKYSKFLYFTFPKDLTNYLGGNLPSLLLAPYFPLAELGFFGLAVTLAMRPVNLIVNAVYQSLYQQCIELYNQHLSMRFLERILLRSIVIVTPCFACLYFAIPYLIDFLLGSQWQPTATYMQRILPWILFTLLLNPFDFLADIFGRQGTLLVFEIVLTLLRAIALLSGIKTGNFATAITLYAACSCLVMALRTLWYVRLIYKYEKTLTP